MIIWIEILIYLTKCSEKRGYQLNKILVRILINRILLKKIVIDGIVC
jgi:hypothetical protein